MEVDFCGQVVPADGGDALHVVPSPPSGRAPGAPAPAGLPAGRDTRVSRRAPDERVRLGRPPGVRHRGTGAAPPRRGSRPARMPDRVEEAAPRSRIRTIAPPAHAPSNSTVPFRLHSGNRPVRAHPPVVRPRDRSNAGRERTRTRPGARARRYRRNRLERDQWFDTPIGPMPGPVANDASHSEPRPAASTRAGRAPLGMIRTFTLPHAGHTLRSGRRHRRHRSPIHGPPRTRRASPPSPHPARFARNPARRAATAGRSSGREDLSTGTRISATSRARPGPSQPAVSDDRYRRLRIRSRHGHGG
jgi:hypothetical protein